MVKMCICPSGKKYNQKTKSSIIPKEEYFFKINEKGKYEKYEKY
tara:strand:- start:4560 stop:4691 length:132 start_codon:yes stop_codon:yes gene_type:complete